MRVVYLTILFSLLFIIIYLVFLLSFSPEKLKHFRITDCHIRLVDFIHIDSSGCIEVAEFSPNSNHKYSAVEVTFSKEYIAESKLFFNHAISGKMARGLQGSYEKIDSVRFWTNDHNGAQFTLNNILIGLSEKSPLIFNTPNFDIQIFSGQLCPGYKGFESISDFVKQFNENSRRVAGESLQQPVFFYFEKIHLNGLDGEGLEVVMAIYFNSGHIQICKNNIAI